MRSAIKAISCGIKINPRGRSVPRSSSAPYWSTSSARKPRINFTVYAALPTVAKTRIESTKDRISTSCRPEEIRTHMSSRFKYNIVRKSNGFDDIVSMVTFLFLSVNNKTRSFINDLILSVFFFNSNYDVYFE